MFYRLISTTHLTGFNFLAVILESHGGAPHTSIQVVVNLQYL